MEIACNLASRCALCGQLARRGFYGSYRASTDRYERPWDEAFLCLACTARSVGKPTQQMDKLLRTGRWLSSIWFELNGVWYVISNGVPTERGFPDEAEIFCLICTRQIPLSGWVHPSVCEDCLGQQLQESPLREWFPEEVPTTWYDGQVVDGILWDAEEGFCYQDPVSGFWFPLPSLPAGQAGGQRY